MTLEPANCRCGWNGEGPHPCHGRAYTCKEPSYARFVPNLRASLAGAQMKFSCYITYACNECWRAFTLSQETAR